MMLANVGSDILSQLERFKESFLWAAAKGGRVEECESLLQMGTDVNWVSPEGDTPLLAACRNGHVQVALCLLSHGASVNHAAKDGQTALHLSCRYGKEAVAEALILEGADVNAKDNGGATAFESQGPHVPDGMLRRLNAIAQRSMTRSLRQDDISVEPTTVSPRGGTAGFGISGTRHSSISILDAATQRVAADERVSEGSDFDRSGWRRSGISQNQNDFRPGDDGHDGTDDVGSAAVSAGHDDRDDAQRGRGSRTTFPSISRKVGSTNASRQPSRFRIASRTELYGGGAPSSEDEEELPSEGETRFRRLGGVYHGPSLRKRGDLLGRDRRGESGHFPGNVQLLSVGDPVPHASAAIAAAIASASGTAQPASGVTTNASTSSTTPPDTPAAASSRSPGQSFDFSGTTATPWHSSDPGRGRGHRITVGNSNSNSNSNTVSSGDSGRVSRSSSSSSIGGRGTGRGASSGPIRGGGSEEIRLGAESTTTQVHLTEAISRRDRSNGAWGSRPTDATAGRDEDVGNPVASSEEGGAPGGGYAQRWIGGVGEYCRGDASYPTSDVPVMESRTSGSIRAAVAAGGRRYGGGQDCDLAEGSHASNDHVGLIRVLWLQEKESRLASEAKADAIRDQSARLWNELVRSEKQVLSLEEEMASLREERDKLKATLSGKGLKGRSLAELELLEKDLRKALEGVCEEKDRIVQDKEEQRLCVVCQENERGVLLLPCRHLCVCRGCSQRQELTLCPLCRDRITESLVVYS